ncbi:hypothetical protein Fcan01_20490 [Folsomia candida]|uniref:Uncharacterized protein n=1 Tax=Folsomia candida TaxID=158441 RepID=A0A226DI52_FOLCA|nr:hypothetical protein Fcan01_20490 [Folsomia candida]
MKILYLFVLLGVYFQGTRSEMITEGTKLDWVYHRDGISYHMTSNMTAPLNATIRQRFNVTTTTTPHLITSFSLDGSNYVSLVNGNLRQNVLPTLKEISRLTPVSARVDPFTEMIEAMFRNQHVYNGSEIFIAGSYISWIPGYQNLIPFLILPPQVKLITLTQDWDNSPYLRLFVHDAIPIADHLGLLTPRPIPPLLVFVSDLLPFNVMSTRGEFWLMNDFNEIISSTEGSNFDFHLTSRSTFHIYWNGMNPGYIRTTNFTNDTVKLCACGTGPPAEFYVTSYEVDMRMYERKEDAPEMAYLIKLFGEARLFTELLSVMAEKEQFWGKEIFAVASHIAPEDEAISFLPETVQLINSLGSNLTWTYIRGDGEEYPMQHYWASFPQNETEKYSFYVRAINWSPAKMAILYGNGGEGQMYRIFVANNQLMEELWFGPELWHDLELSLSRDLSTIQISKDGLTLMSNETVPEFYFNTNGFGEGANFRISRYSGSLE